MPRGCFPVDAKPFVSGNLFPAEWDHWTFSFSICEGRWFTLNHRFVFNKWENNNDNWENKGVYKIHPPRSGLHEPDSSGRSHAGPCWGLSGARLWGWGKQSGHGKKRSCEVLASNTAGRSEQKWPSSFPHGGECQAFLSSHKHISRWHQKWIAWSQPERDSPMSPRCRSHSQLFDCLGNECFGPDGEI